MTESFDVCGPLPTGVTVLEASAGTGKTFTIAALATRYVAEGIPLEQILMVTFTRMATGELRERVRERLVSAEHGLERALAGAPPQDDAVVQLLATGSPTVVALRRERLAAALADFDSATIATTHGFCQEVLGGLGVAGDVEPDTTFVEDVDELIEEVVDDLYVRRFHHGGTPSFTRSDAAEIARAAIKNPAAPIVPATGAVPEMRRRLALAVRDELDQRKRRMAVMTFDDLLTRLDDTLAGDGGAAAAARLRARWPTSTPPPSPPPTRSARRCWAVSASSATWAPTRRSWRTSATCAARSSTTCTCAASAAATRRSSAAPRR